MEDSTDIRVKEIIQKLTANELMSLHSFFCTKRAPNSIRSTFTIHEDLLIKQWVGTHGPFDWKKCADLIPGKNARQCRERYNHYILFSKCNIEWTQEEDNLLRKCYSMYGPKWSLIASYLPNRTDISVKNRWIVLIRKQFITNKVNPQTENVLIEDDNRSDEGIEFTKPLVFPSIDELFAPL